MNQQWFHGEGRIEGAFHSYLFNQSSNTSKLDVKMKGVR